MFLVRNFFLICLHFTVLFERMDFGIFIILKSVFFFHYIKYLVSKGHDNVRKVKLESRSVSELAKAICGSLIRIRNTDHQLRHFSVQHVKSIRGSIDSYTQANYKPPMLNDR